MSVGEWKYYRLTGETGPQGIQGIQGPAGDDGNDGIGIQSISYLYATSQTQTGTKTTYQTTMPTLSATNKYLWQKETITFTSGNPKVTEAIIGTYGDTGSQGPQGIQGIQGPKGDTGAAGAKGDKGDTGATGAQGPKGTDATQYYYHVVYVNDTSSGSGYGTTPNSQLYTGTYVDTTSSDAATWAIAKTKGVKWNYTKGATGATGAQGPKGDTGAAGAKGDKGDTGAQGIQGPKGDTGAQGPQGSKGDTGATGPQGPQGNPGANAPNLKAQYSVNGTSNWHDNFTSGDLYIRTSNNNGTSWSTGIKIVGLDGATGQQGPKGDTGATGPQGPTGPQGGKGDTGLTGAQYLVQWNRSQTITAPSSSDSGWRDTPYEADSTYHYIWMRVKSVPAGTNPSSVSWSNPTRQSQYEKWIELSTSLQVFEVNRRGNPISFSVSLTSNNVTGTFSLSATNCTLSASTITLTASETSGSVTCTYTPSRINGVPSDITISASNGSFSDTYSVRLVDVTEYNLYSEIATTAQYNSWMASGLSGDYAYFTDDINILLEEGLIVELYNNNGTIAMKEITATASRDQVLTVLGTILNKGDGTIPEKTTAVNVWCSRLAANEIFANTIKGQFAEFDGITIKGNSRFEGNIENEAITAVNGASSTTTWTGTSTASITTVDSIKAKIDYLPNNEVLDDETITVGSINYNPIINVTNPDASISPANDYEDTATWSGQSGNYLYARVDFDEDFRAGVVPITLTFVDEPISSVLMRYVVNFGYSFESTPSSAGYVQVASSRKMAAGYSFEIPTSSQPEGASFVNIVALVSAEILQVVGDFTYNLSYPGVTSRQAYGISSSGLYGLQAKAATLITNTSATVSVNQSRVTPTLHVWNGSNIKRGSTVVTSGSVVGLSSCSVTYNGTTKTTIPQSVVWDSMGIRFNYADSTIYFDRNNPVSSFSCSFSQTASGSLLELSTALPADANVNLGSASRPYNEVFANTVHGKVKYLNPNLLDNPWFTINQRRSTTFSTGADFKVDRWKSHSNYLTVSAPGEGISLQPTTTLSGSAWLIRQDIEASRVRKGFQYTASANITGCEGTIAGVGLYLSFRNSSDSEISNVKTMFTQPGLVSVTTTIPNNSNLDHIRVGIYFQGSPASLPTSSKIYIGAVKLETGSTSTLDLEDKPNYVTELLKCQRYYVSFEYATPVNGYTTGGSSYVILPLPVEMRGYPSLTSTPSFVVRYFGIQLTLTYSLAEWHKSFVLLSGGSSLSNYHALGGYLNSSGGLGISAEL